MYKSSLSFISAEVGPFFYLLLIVDLILKGVTLYKSAQRDQKVWFVALLLVNSMGILPIIYLLINKDLDFSTTTKGSSTKSAKKVRAKK